MYLGPFFNKVEDDLRCHLETWIGFEKQFEHVDLFSRHEWYIAETVG